MNQFHVKISFTKEWNWLMEFYYSTDLRFEVKVPILDAVAISHWCRGACYASKDINF